MEMSARIKLLVINLSFLSPIFFLNRLYLLLIGTHSLVLGIPNERKKEKRRHHSTRPSLISSPRPLSICGGEMKAEGEDGMYVWNKNSEK